MSEFSVQQRSNEFSDAVTAAFSGGDPELIDLNYRSMIRAALHSGEVYFATDASGKIVAVGIWFAPGQELWATEKQRALGFNDVIKASSPKTIEWLVGTYKPIMAEFVSKALSPRVKKDTWFANVIATDPAYQRRGLARALIEPVYQKALANNALLATCAVSDTNCTVFKKLGWEYKGRVDIPSPVSSDPFPIICLTRGS
ncbi:hypothetical protein DENSPDRAFT_849606 [Dentipellis sp. KUC8613]|nr:hypothetical protein DENSPDRAFT_849606 [Dentipellis sp. KUC8613]